MTRDGLGELLERSEELGEIRACAQAVAGGEGRALVVEGPAGIGKTALVAAAEPHARDAGLSALTARGTELERAFGFGVVRQLFEPRRSRTATARRSRARRAVRRRCSTSSSPSPPSCRSGRKVRSPPCTASTG